MTKPHQEYRLQGPDSHVSAHDYGVAPGVDCWQEWRALRLDVIAIHAQTGGRVYVHLQTPGEYWLQYHNGAGAPYAGHGLMMVSGMHIVGAPGVVMASLPASEGGVAGRVIGVMNPGGEIRDIGLHSLTVRNDAAGSQWHAVMFYSWISNAQIYYVRGVHIENVRITGAGGDGLYIGAHTEGVTYSQGAVSGCGRHGVAISSVGDRSGFLFEDIDMAAPTSGHAFHIEADGIDMDAAYTLLTDEPDATVEQLADVLQGVRAGLLRRCHFEGNFAFNGAALWRVEDCTAKPRPNGGIGGSMLAGNAPGITVDRCTWISRQANQSTSAKAILVLGEITSVVVSECLIESRPNVDGTPLNVIGRRPYSPGGTLYGKQPRSLVMLDCTVLSRADAPLYNGTIEEPGWDLSGVRRCTYPAAE